MPAAKQEDTVRVHYVGRLTDGSVFDSSEGRSPLEFRIGDATVIAGFEEGVTGLEPGGRRTVEIAPENAYGARDERLVHVVDADAFAMDPYVDGEVELIDPDGDAMRGRITAVENDEVTLDFNHPLAGQTLVFDIELQEIVRGD
jgi:FKBP-type peptidyl-prolyl cis-trans isomerase 2